MYVYASASVIYLFLGPFPESFRLHGLQQGRGLSHQKGPRGLQIPTYTKIHSYAKK